MTVPQIWVVDSSFGSTHEQCTRIVLVDGWVYQNIAAVYRPTTWGHDLSIPTKLRMAPEEFEQRDTLAKLGPLGQVQLGYSISRCDPNVPLIFHQLCISTINLSYTTILSYWPGRVNWGIWEFWPLHRLMWSSVQDCRSPNKINGHFRNRFIGGTCHIIYKGYVRAM